MTGAQAASKATRDMIDPVAIMRIKDLMLRARVVVEGFMSGLHRSPYHGFSVEFSEYRPYSLGDDPRSLDWKLYARSDRYFVKRFEDETNRRCYLVVDQSGSMEFGSLTYTKADYARTLAATFAYFLSRQRDAVGLLTFTDKIIDFIPARFRPGQLRQMMVALAKPTDGKSTDIRSPLDQITKVVRKRSLVILISDLLVPAAELRQQLSLLRSRGHEVLILRTLDPREIEFQMEKAGMVEDMESGQTLFIDPATAAKDYRERFKHHSDELRAIVDELGIDLFAAVTDRPLETSLFEVLNSLQSRGRGGRVARSMA